MTAEIAIMNKNAIALAADSAVTINGSTNTKIFTSANKLFALSKKHPVGVMIYQNATFMGIPWETIIKIYRNELGDIKFDTLEEYADSFLAFLTQEEVEMKLFPNNVQENYMYSTIRNYFRYIKECILKDVNSKMEKRENITPEDVEPIVIEVINNQYELWRSTKNIPSIPESYNQIFLDKYGDQIEEIIKEIFELLPMPQNTVSELKEMASDHFTKFPPNIINRNFTGVVIAGFGDKEYFPSIKAYHLESVVMNKLKYEEKKNSKISFDYISGIYPFAQREMVDTFICGSDPQYGRIINKYINNAFERYTQLIVDNLGKYSVDEKNNIKQILIDANANIIKDFEKQMDDYQKKNYVNPITGIVSLLPKDELALMAESLVNITSFKRKMSMGAETVGGPIDVAVISKGDGFIWIKRKHYFKQELNSQFIVNRFREAFNDQ